MHRPTSIIATRGEPGTLEVLLVERSSKLRFFGGYWTFPGGGIEEVDRRNGERVGAVAAVRCAIRELIDKTDLVVDGIPGDHGRIRGLVRRLGGDAAARRQWRDLLDRSAPALAVARHVCRITTPPFIPLGYTTDFVHVPIADGQDLRLTSGKIAQGHFVRPADAIGDWVEGRRLIVPPVLFLLELLVQHGAREFLDEASRAAAGFADGALQPIRFSPGVFMAPLASPTLLPATTTNCLIVGRDRLYIVDPAPYEQAARERLFDKLDELRGRGAELCGILLTHHHRDHIGAAAAVSRRYDLPVRAHERAFEALSNQDFRRGEPLRDGDRIALGTAPDGTPEWHLDVLHTPGHSPDHLCFIESRYHAAIVGDLLSTVSTILIDPPEGHMRTYLASLARLLERPLKTLYPAHGPAHRDAHLLIRHYLIHRRQREKMILNALGASPLALEQILPQAYADTAPELYAVASRSLAAGLEKLAEDGLAAETPRGWVAIKR